jgi:GH3 auxin-responsive promoter
MQYYETYNASEGFFGIQDLPSGREMLLMLDYGIFYEFIPMSQWNSEHPDTLTLDQVKTGENYAVVISTNAGLWRYKIGDTISFTSLKPFRFRITGRTAHFINAFGEELIVENADRAIATACNKSGCLVRDYTACPVYISGKNAGAHEWLIEFELPPADIVAFTTLLDAELKNVNSDYEAKRYHDMALREPIVRVMPENTFYNWLKSKGKVGGQHKVPRLSNDRVIVEEILLQAELKPA